jgi:hypothetical protein
VVGSTDGAIVVQIAPRADAVGCAAFSLSPKALRFGRIDLPAGEKGMERDIHRLREPKQCLYWDHPELVRVGLMKERFELMETFADESHLRDIC